MDSSKTKSMPDSFSRTIPIWCAVLNQLVASSFANQSDKQLWEKAFFTPESCVMREEHEHILINVIPVLVSDIQKAGPIDVKWLQATLTKPLHPYWITPLSFKTLDVTNKYYNMQQYTSIICVNASNPSMRGHLIETNLQNTFSDKISQQMSHLYTPGAADDEESWAQGLTPALFWANLLDILETRNQIEIDPRGKVDEIVNTIVQRAKDADEEWYSNRGKLSRLDIPVESLSSAIGMTGLFLGSRRSGRPPECWKNFDAILNVSMLEYQGMEESCKFYLQLPVKEGKKDRSELERWMAVGLLFILFHLQKHRKILVHCAQGKDRSVAVVVAAIKCFCEFSNDSPLKLASWCQSFCFEHSLANVESDSQRPLYKHSGLQLSTVDNFLGREGRERFFELITPFHKSPGPSSDGVSDNFSKSNLRYALNIVQRYHSNASPTRKTMQKLNRFFLSSEYENGDLEITKQEY